MTELIAMICASITFIQSGSVAEPYREFDVYWQDYAIEGKTHRLWAIAIARSRHCANLISIDQFRYLPRCDTMILMGDGLGDSLALSLSLENGYLGNVNYYGLPDCKDWH